jgi:NADH dehydrogenase
MSKQPIRIGILGGGFGGLYTALRLNQLQWEGSARPEIVLIDKNDRFVFSPLLYELVTGEMQAWEVAPPYEDVFANTGITVRQGTITGIDLATKTVALADQPALTCDRLVVALGGKTPVDGIPGVKEHALPFRTLADASRLQQKLRHLEQDKTDPIRVVIVGGGYSGVELACKLADRLGDRSKIRIVDRSEEILKGSPAFNRKTALAALETRKIWLDLSTSVESVQPEAIALLYKGQVDTIPADLVLWTVGTEVGQLIQSLPVAKTAQGLIQVNSTLQIEAFPDCFAMGDATDCVDAAGQLLPATGQVALQQADYCAWNVWASLCDRPFLPFRYQPLGEMLSLGVDQATLTGLGIQLTGPAAYLARRLAYLYRLPTLNHQIAVGFNWLTQPLINALAQQN